jgi:thiol-disulfide isomerase/thioredoxin
VPEQLPEIRLPGPDGAVHSLADWKGRPLVVNFWATWCEPCRREIPLLKNLRRERAADGLEIVGIAVDYPDAVGKYTKAHGIDYPVLIGEEGGLAAAGAFGMDPVLPFSVFADRTGRVVTLKVGELQRDEAELILDRVHDVDAGRLSISTAREQISEGVPRLRRVQSGSD